MHFFLILSEKSFSTRMSGKKEDNHRLYFVSWSVGGRTTGEKHEDTEKGSWPLLYLSLDCRLHLYSPLPVCVGTVGL